MIQTSPTTGRRWATGGFFDDTPKTPGRDPLIPADKPFGEWNKFRITQAGALTWVWLNDKLVVDCAEWENSRDRAKPLPASGPILRQTHGRAIRWRNIFVREIFAGEAAHWRETTPSPACWPYESRDPS